MTENYDFLRSFTIDGKDTKHLFQIAKLNIPFLSKENEFFTVGNTDGKHFRNTKLGDYTLSIDGFIIKDNTGKTVPQVMDELKALVNSDEPQQLVFDIFPDRYFNAIFTGAEEYDATDLKYTPLTLTFDVPDGMAHALQTIGFSNTYSTTTNLMLDSEYNAINKYLKPWVQKLDEKFNNSNIVYADFTGGIPLNFERDRNSDERWLNWSPLTTVHVPDLKAGDDVNFSVYAQVVSIDEENNKNYAGQLMLEEWDTVKSAILKVHYIDIPKQVTTEFIEYGSVVKIENEKTNALCLQYGFRGNNIIKWSKPMLSVLPPIGETVTAPSVGAKAYSNSLDFGNYDYSGRANLVSNLDFSKFSGSATTMTKPLACFKDNETYLELDSSDPSVANTSRNIYVQNCAALLPNNTYIMTVPMMINADFDDFRTLVTLKTSDGTALGAINPPSENVGTWQNVTKTFTVPANLKFDTTYLQLWQPKEGNGKIYIGYNIKIEKVTSTSDTATPYQPNLLDAPYYLSKVVLGENIADPTVKFPIQTSAYQLYGSNMLEEFKVGQKYTITIKATKPSTSKFRAYNDGNTPLGYFAPVEGLTDVWSSKFIPTTVSITSPKLLSIYQVSTTTLGACKIDWIKIEKGDTRTPNIPYYKYEGIAPAPSNNPKDYHWGYSPSYINAVEYVPSGDSVGDVIKIENNGTYKTKPRFSFRMKGENGLVSLLHQNGAILQFGNPEDVDGVASSRVEQGLNETFWGNTLNPNLQVNTGFNSIYPYMGGDPSKPTYVQGTWDMTQDVDAVTPIYKYVGDIGAWHGPTIMADVDAPSNTDRTLPVSSHFRFIFDNYSKRQCGRIEFSTFDELDNPIMTAIIRDSSLGSNDIIFEAWYKGNKIHETTLDRKVFSNSFYEMNMDRSGNILRWRMSHIKSLANKPGGWSQAIIDKEYTFVWTLPEPEVSKFTKTGFWIMRHSNNPYAPMRMTDMQTRWNGTPYYQDLRNVFQDGDLVEIDTATREVYVNGVVNNQLNVVGNQWEKFELEPGETILQPVVSTWANMAEVTAEIRQNYL